MEHMLYEIDYNIERPQRSAIWLGMSEMSIMSTFYSRGARRRDM